MDIYKEALELHKKYRGKIQIQSKVEVKERNDLSRVYTPGVAAVAQLLGKNPELTSHYTNKGNTVAVISDGSAVLGLGNIGPYGAYPVMEGKCVLFKEFADIDAIPLVLNVHTTKEIVDTVCAIAPTFGGINLEDIASPLCFEIEKELQAKLSIPVIHDDQWGAASAVLTGLINALKLRGLTVKDARIVISGAGAAGSATAKLLHQAGAAHIIICDSKGIIYKGRGDGGDKAHLATIGNPDNIKGNLQNALKNAHVFIGLSKGNLLSKDDIMVMEKKPIIFALANPEPEIKKQDAQDAGAYIYASGSSDDINQINNAIIYPGVFRGALDHSINHITHEMLIKVAGALASLVENPTPESIMPSVFDKRVVKIVADCIV